MALPYVAQANQTDWAFLRERAARIGHEVFVRDKVLHFRPPAAGTPAKQTLRVGDDVTEFRPRLSAVGQVGEVTVRGWDVTKKTPVVGRAVTGQEYSLMGGDSAPGRRPPTRRSGRRATARVDLAPGTKAEADMIALGDSRRRGAGLRARDGRVRRAAGPAAPARSSGSRVRARGSAGRTTSPPSPTSSTPTGYRTTLAAERSGA